VENFELGAFLRKERERQHLSSRDLAERTRKSEHNKGVTASHINKIENGKARPTFQTLQKIVAALEIPLVIILDGSKANPDAVTIVSTPEIAQFLPQALSHKELVQLLLACEELTDEQIESILGVARNMRSSTRSMNETGKS
jgi:transcriptional regulator with XRE-family HTH domain